ncbi:MAG TPA: ATP phosphoribosyltransferase [Armatimonadaceae bacterium]|nr:ATP phosphoribosyltransferase [Armatimonadaceae bacterium]
MELKLGLPKGSLQESTFKLFEKAGWNIRVDSRSYQPVVDDPEISALLIRPQELPRYLEDGILDVGLTGKDWIEDCGADVHEVCELTYSKATRNVIRVVLAVHNDDTSVESVADLKGKRIATEYVRLTERFLASHGVTDASVEFSWGACEVKVPVLADAIVVNTETGSSIRAHNLRIVDTILTSTTRLVANHQAWADPEKRAKIENMAMLLNGALNAGALVGLKMNVGPAQRAAVEAQLPALRRPTVSPLADDGWVALEIIIGEREARDLIPRLKRAGAEGIVEYPLNKVVY